jgi:hypothetical protein
MGMDARCRARYAGQISEGTVQLETESIIFRGDFRVQIPLRELRAVENKGTELHLEWGAENCVFEMGPVAAKWAEAILHPPRLVDKLGVKADQRITLIGAFDTGFAGELRAAGAKVSNRLGAECDMILLEIAERGDLVKTADLRASLSGNGMLWVVYPKGQKSVTQNDVIEAGRRAGLVDVKVASFSNTHTALKFVVPVHKREKK